jgi:putative acetyltransferase
MVKWRLRDSRPEDIDAMYEVWRTSALDTHDFVTESDFAEICVQVRNDYLPGRDFTVAIDETDRVVGFLAMEGHEIDSLFIAPDFRGQGLGRSFVTMAAQQQQHDLEVEVNTQNSQAVGFYEAMGFRVIAIMDVDRHGRPYPLLRMKRSSNS